MCKNVEPEKPTQIEDQKIECKTCLTVMNNLRIIPLPLKRYELTSDKVLSTEACRDVIDYFEVKKCHDFVENRHTFLILALFNYGPDLTCHRLSIC